MKSNMKARCLSAHHAAKSRLRMRRIRIRFLRPPAGLCVLLAAQRTFSNGRYCVDSEGGVSGWHSADGNHENHLDFAGLSHAHLLLHF